MGRNRPINRRPFRRPPWRKSSRPKRWNAVTSPTNNEGGITTLSPLTVPLMIAGGQVEPALLQLVSGQVDVEPWADEQEVTIDRIIGQIHYQVAAQQDPSQFLAPPRCLIKAGILVNEEITQDISPQALNLFEQETMEDYEWMWLNTTLMKYDETQRFTDTAGDAVVLDAVHTLELDIRNRRKVGQSDELNLYIQAMPLARIPTGPAELLIVEALVELRQVMMSR